MFDGLSYSFRLWRLRVRQREAEKENDQKRRLARQSNDDNAISLAEHEAWTDHQDFEGSILVLQTRYLIRLGNKYLVPYPEQSDWAKEEPPFYYHHLTREGLMKLRAAIRGEQKELWDSRMRWAPLLSAIAGVLGVLVGLVSAIKH